MKKPISLFCAFLTVITLSAQEPCDSIVVHDIDNDGIADTVRIDRENRQIVCALSSKEFTPVTSKRIEELDSLFKLQPADSGFMLYSDRKDEELYRAGFTFKYNPALYHYYMQISTVNENHRRLQISFPGTAQPVTYLNCNRHVDLENGKISITYSQGDQRVTKEFVGNRSGGPLDYFSFSDLYGGLQGLVEGLSWNIMDELYPKGQRTPEFIDALPVDPRSPHLLVHDMDGDRVSDTVRIHQDTDNWTIIVEARLSRQGFEPVSTTTIRHDPRYSGLSPKQGGFALRTKNMESDTYETSDIFIYDPLSGKMILSWENSKHYGYQINLPGRIHGLLFYDEVELHFYPLKGKYILNYMEDGVSGTREYTAPFALTVTLENFCSDKHLELATRTWDGFVASLMDEMDYPPTIEVPAYIREPEFMSSTTCSFILDMDGDGQPDSLTIDPDKKALLLKISDAGYETLRSGIIYDTTHTKIGEHEGGILVIKDPFYTYCFGYHAQYRQVYMTSVYRRDEGKDFCREKVYYPIDGLAQKNIRTDKTRAYPSSFQKDGYVTLWDTRRVELITIPFDGFDPEKLLRLVSYIDREMENTRNGIIEVSDEFLP